MILSATIIINFDQTIKCVLSAVMFPPMPKSNLHPWIKAWAELCILICWQNCQICVPAGYSWFMFMMSINEWSRQSSVYMRLSAVESFSFSSISLCVARVASIILKQSESIFHQFFCSFEVDRNPRTRTLRKAQTIRYHYLLHKTKTFHLFLSAVRYTSRNEL